MFAHIFWGGRKQKETRGSLTVLTILVMFYFLKNKNCIQQVCQKVSISKSSHPYSNSSQCLKYFLITNSCENILSLGIKRGTVTNLIFILQMHSILKSRSLDWRQCVCGEVRWERKLTSVRNHIYTSYYLNILITDIIKGVQRASVTCPVCHNEKRSQWDSNCIWLQSPYSLPW